MGRKKVFLKLPKRVKLHCPHCSRDFSFDTSGNTHTTTCTACSGVLTTPITQCCLICAYSEKNCPYSVRLEAHAKGLTLR